MFQVFLSTARLLNREDIQHPDFETVLRAQLGGPDHRLAELNGELARIGTDDPSALPLLLEAGRCYLDKHDYVTQKRYAVQAYECAAAWGDPIGTAAAGMALGVACCWTGDLRLARIHADRVAAYLDGLDAADLGPLLPVLVDLSWVETQLQRLPEAEAHQRRGLRVAEALGSEEHWVLLQVLLGATLRELGRLADAERHTERAREIAELRDNGIQRELALIALGEIALEAGDTRRTHEMAVRARAAAGSLTRFARAALMLIGLTMIRTGEPQDGRDLVLEAAGGKLLPLVPVGARTRVYAGLASADAALGHHAEAVRWSELAMRTTWACDLDRAMGYAQLAHAEALLKPDPGGAQRAADLARTAFERVDAHLGLAAAYRMVGMAQGRLNRLAESTAALARSEELYRGCAATIAADEIRLLRMTTRSAADRATEHDQAAIECLSPREMQVARLIAQGSSNQQIAGALNIKTNTVQVHVGQILRKLRVPSRAAVARLVTLAEATELVSGQVRRGNN
ncbi:LuxR C-terminal-related transcriptional regulator [Micromonospora sp. NPDC002296]|uniref:LuxR C-terminal-related transcriptional regulator n=1 Tax=Micromonospora sp. NPDC002296 TaxID=3154271 RepID=UPI00332563BC